MLEKQRQQLILDILYEHKFASVKMLCEQLHSSEATIRRDLIKLEDQKKLRKIRGGAESVENGAEHARQANIKGSTFLVNREHNAEVKRLIAQKAASLCEDGESIIVNGGSSTFMMGEFLSDKKLNMLTNSIYLAQELMETSNIQITLPGGEIYRGQGIILSAFENDSIQYYHASKMFMGTPGISEFGVMESDPLLIRSEKKLRKQAEQLIILADSTKLGKRSNFIFESLDHVDTLITDSGASDEQLEPLQAAGVRIIQVPQPEPRSNGQFATG